jgi:hypothetical protein
MYREFGMWPVMYSGGVRVSTIRVDFWALRDSNWEKDRIFRVWGRGLRFGPGGLGKRGRWLAVGRGRGWGGDWTPFLPKTFDSVQVHLRGIHVSCGYGLGEDQGVVRHVFRGLL